MATNSLQLLINVIGYHHGMHLRVRYRRRIRIAPVVCLQYTACELVLMPSFVDGAKIAQAYMEKPRLAAREAAIRGLLV